MFCDQFGLGFIETRVGNNLAQAAMAPKPGSEEIPDEPCEKILRLLKKGGIELPLGAVSREILDGRGFSPVCELALTMALIAAWHRTDVGGPFVFASALNHDGFLAPLSPAVFDRIVLENRAVQHLDGVPARIFIAEQDSAAALKERLRALECLPLFSIMGAETLADVVDEWMGMERLARDLASPDI
jgi:hypothetical protein